MELVDAFVSVVPTISCLFLNVVKDIKILASIDLMTGVCGSLLKCGGRLFGKNHVGRSSVFLFLFISNFQRRRKKENNKEDKALMFFSIFFEKVTKME